METKNQEKENEKTTAGYKCPMSCDHDKVYTQPGTCPICKEKLLPIEDKKPPARCKCC